MNASYRFAKKWLPYAAAFMLFACGGGGSGDDDDSGIRETNDAVSAANSTVPQNVFTATLNSAQAAPQTSSTATGIGVVVIDPVSRLMRATLTTAGVAGISADILLAQPGTDGTLALALTQAPAGSGIWTLQTTLTADQLTSLSNGNFSFTVRSAAFPEGEIRGQILQQLPGSGITNPDDGTEVNANSIDSGNFIDGGTTTTTNSGDEAVSDGIVADNPFSSAITRRTTFVNVLNGAQQVPANASNAAAIGVAIVDPATGTMVASITSIGAAGVSAHIHRSRPGSNGDMLFMLNETGSGSGIWAARLALSTAQLNTFADGNNYFDIHTSAFPNGEIRGQIVVSGATVSSASGGGTSSGAGTGVVPISPANTPFTPGAVTGAGDTGSTPSGSASVPSLGNPVGSGIGGAGSTSVTGTGIPTFGNPAGSGIGGATGGGFTGAGIPTFGNPAASSIGNQPSTSFIGTSVPSTAGFDTGAGTTGAMGDTGFTTSTTNAPEANGVSSSRF